MTNPVNAQSTAYNVVNVGEGQSGSSGGISGKETVRYENAGPGGFGVATSIGAPYIFNSNPCAIANGGSAVGGPFAASISITNIDKACDKRSNAGALVGMKQSGMAVIEMCQQESVADSFWYTYYLVCPGTKVKDKFTTPDGSKPVMALINPVTGEIMNIRSSPVWGPYLKSKEMNVVTVSHTRQQNRPPDFCYNLSSESEKIKYKDVCGVNIKPPQLQKEAAIIPR